MQRRKYKEGGLVYEDLTPEEQAEYDSLDNDAAKADFLNLLNQQGEGAPSPEAAAKALEKDVSGLGMAAGMLAPVVLKATGAENTTGGRVAGNVLSKAGQGAQAGTMIAPGIGTALGAGVGAVVGGIESLFSEKKRKKQIQENRLNQNISNARANSLNADVDIQSGTGEEGLAEGGTVDGPGTAKSDSVKTKLKPGSFVVPAEYAAQARQLHAHYFGIPTKLKDGGKVPVALSDGEFVFSPRQVSYLRQKGINLDALAPNAKEGNEMKDGGEVKYINNRINRIKQDLANIEKLGDDAKYAKDISDLKAELAAATKEKVDLLKGDKAAKDAVGKPKFSDDPTIEKFALRLRDAGANEEEVKKYVSTIKGGKYTNKEEYAQSEFVKAKNNIAKNAVKPVSKDLGESNEWGLNAMKGMAPVTPATPSVSTINNSPAPTAATTPKRTGKKAPVIKRAVKEAEAVAGTPASIAAATANRNLGPVTDDGTTAGMSGDPYRDIAAAARAAEPKMVEGTIPQLAPGQAQTAKTSGSFAGEGDAEKKQKELPGEDSFTRGMAILGAAQTGIGLTQLLTAGDRPEDMVDPTLLMRRDEAIDDAKVKMDPAVQAAARNDIELNRRGTINSAWNAVAGDVGTGVAATLAASRTANRGIVDLAAEKERLGMIKNQRADNLTGAVAGAKRQIFQDKLDAFKENQQSMAELTQAGINNYIESRRLANQSKNLRLLEGLDGGNITEDDILAIARSRKSSSTR